MQSISKKKYIFLNKWLCDVHHREKKEESDGNRPGEADAEAGAEAGEASVANAEGEASTANVGDNKRIG